MEFLEEFMSTSVLAKDTGRTLWMFFVIYNSNKKGPYKYSLYFYDREIKRDQKLYKTELSKTALAKDLIIKGDDETLKREAGRYVFKSIFFHNSSGVSSPEETILNELIYFLTK